MSGTSSGPDGSGHRWWEVWGGREPAEARYSGLVTGGRGRSRPERSLSAGADPADEARHPLRGFLWPAVSVVAAGALILFVVFAMPKVRSTSPDSTRSTVAVAPGGAQSGVGGAPLIPPPPAGNSPGALPPLGNPAAMPVIPAPPAGGGAGGGSGGGSNGNQGGQPTGTPASGPSAAPAPRMQVYGPAPSAPGPRQEGPPVHGTGGCTGSASSGYACMVIQDAPLYLAGTTDPRGPVPAGWYPFLCQSDGSTYSIGDRANHWWAWAGNGNAGGWIPVVFLSGGPNNKPEPGLPVCGSKPTSTTAPTTKPSS